MPTFLLLSLRFPKVRYGLAAPAALVAGGLAARYLWDPPGSPAARVGWLLVLAGVLLGGSLGAWFWFRWLPVPGRLANPYAPGRWALIAVHAGLVVIGLALLGASVLIG